VHFETSTVNEDGEEANMQRVGSDSMTQSARKYSSDEEDGGTRRASVASVDSPHEVPQPSCMSNTDEEHMRIHESVSPMSTAPATSASRPDSADGQKVG
jgi:hypothetical protein